MWSPPGMRSCLWSWVWVLQCWGLCAPRALFGAGDTGSTAELLVMALLSVDLAALLLPLIFRFGTERARMLMFFVIGALVALMLLFGSDLSARLLDMHAVVRYGVIALASRFCRSPTCSHSASTEKKRCNRSRRMTKQSRPYTGRLKPSKNSVFCRGFCCGRNALAGLTLQTGRVCRLCVQSATQVAALDGFLWFFLHNARAHLFSDK